MNILVNVVNQKMYVSSNADGLVAGSQQFVKFKFNLSEEWNGLMVFAQFRQGSDSYNQYLDADNCVYLPAEIGAGTCTMMLYGSYDTTIGTTNYLTFKINKNNLVYDAESTEISQSLYNQLIVKVSDIQKAVAGKAHLVPEFANSIEECTDTTKLYVLPDGYIYAYVAHEEYPFTNQIPLSIDTDKTVYNGFGYKTGHRINREGLEVEEAGWTVTGYIPIKAEDVLRFQNIDYRPSNSASDGYLCFYNGNFEYIQSAKAVDGLDSITFVVGSYTTDETTGQLTSLTVRDKYSNGVSYFRIASKELDNSAVITVNEEITGEPVVSYNWTNTGHAFVPADYEDRIVKAENDIATLKQVISGDLAVYGIVDDENNILMTGTLTVGKYKLKYMDENGSTTEIGEFTME